MTQSPTAGVMSTLQYEGSTLQCVPAANLGPANIQLSPLSYSNNVGCPAGGEIIEYSQPEQIFAGTWDIAAAALQVWRHCSTAVTAISDRTLQTVGYENYFDGNTSQDNFYTKSNA